MMIEDDRVTEFDEAEAEEGAEDNGEPVVMVGLG